MTLNQSYNPNEFKQAVNIYRTYTYVVFGPQKVGKTNLITRFVKDQFTEAHNMTLEGQQSCIINIDNQKFQILVHDTAGQQNLNSMKSVWRGDKDGYIFVYAINNKDSFLQLVEDIKQVKSKSMYKNVPSIVIGNKEDLRNERQVDKAWAQSQMKKFNLKHMQISAKSSSRQEIQKLFVYLIETNEMNLFSEIASEKSKQKKSSKSKFGWLCCDSHDQQKYFELKLLGKSNLNKQSQKKKKN